MKNQLIAIIDFEGSNDQLLARAIRDKGVYCEIFSSRTAREQLEKKRPIGILLNGNCPEGRKAEYDIGVPLDYVRDGFNLDNFLFAVCGAKGDWDINTCAEALISEIRETVGDGKVLLALSGGVDSSVCAALISKAVGRQLTCIFVDTGLMRKNEGDEVIDAFSKFDFTLIRANEQQRFLSKLAGVTDPERKRKIIGEEFIRVFEEQAKKIGAVDFLGQGTIYPDIIESGDGSKGPVKSHHNVGGLPDHVDFKELLEPLKLLFKDEVRALGRALGLSDMLTMRQPFPGPGLAVRCLGEVTEAKLTILRDADAIFREEIAASGIAVSQYFAIITDTKSVGVRDGERTMEYAMTLRAVNTVDFMTADYVKIPYEALDRITCRIVREVEHVNRITYDITPKPPATIEWE